jgi:hypothetical protein
VAHLMIHIIKPWTIWWWLTSKLAHRKLLMWVPNVIAHLIDLEWPEKEQPKLDPLVERHTSHGASGAWMVHQWRLTCVSLVLRDKENHNNVSWQWYKEWPLNTWVDSLLC